MKRWQRFASAAILVSAMALDGLVSAAAESKPEGEMRFALYVTIAPAWLDPGETGPGNLTPFWMLYALHDALVKPMPGNGMAPSLAESWTESPDKLTYEFKLRQGVKFHNGDPFTAEDVKFSFERSKGAQLKQKVKEVIVVDPHTGEETTKYAVHLASGYDDRNKQIVRVQLVKGGYRLAKLLEAIGNTPEAEKSRHRVQELRGPPPKQS